MALTTTQVNQAFLGLLGRPATGAEAAKFAGQLDAATLAQTLLTDASFKNELSVETLSFKTVDLLNTDPAAFVESLYTALLGRASDAEGKAFWLSVAGATPNRADVVSQFIAAVQAQEGTADANAFATIQAEDKALASAWVESLYNNLAGRASDAEGLDFWTNAIVSFAMTPAQVAASFAAALALQGNTTEDGQNFAAKLGVADNFTANFKDFNALITANEKAEQLKNLVTMMNGVNKDSQVDQYVEEITKVGNEYQSIAAVQFTKADDDNLGIDPETGESNLKGAANFTGTYNLTDATKGTIQSSDSATGTEAYLTDTLTVNVTGYDKTTHDTFNLSELPSTSSVEKLVINNGAASVNGAVTADFQYINVNGTGSFNITANTNNTDGLKDISLNSTSGKDNSFTTTNGLVSIKTGAGNDTLDLGFVSKSLSTGAGKDTVIANIGKDATADLGAGDDTFSGNLGQAAKLNAGAGDDTLNVFSAGLFNGDYKKDSKGNIVAEVTIDGGTGTDTLDLSQGLTEFRAIESIKGIEKVVVGNGTTLYATAVSGQKLELSGATGSNLVLDASSASTVDLTKFTNADGSDVAVRVENVKSGNVNLETGTKNFNAIKETISIAKDASKVSIKGFEQGNDHIEIEGTKVAATNLLSLNVDNKIVIDQNAVANNIYFVSTKEKLTITDLNNYLANNGANAKFTNLQEKDVFYIVATDSVNPADGSKPGVSSTAKIIKVEVGKDGTVGKLDQISTVNVADKGMLKATDFSTSPTYTQVVHATDDAAGGTLAITAPTDADAKIVEIDLSNVKNADKLTTLTINGVTDGKSVVLTGLPNNATPVEVKFAADAKLGTITTDGGSANVTLGAGNTATAINLGGTNDKLTLDGTGIYTGITSIAGAETIDGGTNGAKVNLSALPKGANNKLAQFDLENKLVLVTASGDKTVDASSIRDISTELIISAENASGNLTFIGSTTHVSGGQVTDVKTPFVSVNVKDAIISESTKDLKQVTIAASGTATVNEAQIKEGGNLAATIFAGSGSLTVNAAGSNAVDLSSATNFTVANATIAASGDVTATIKGLTSTGNTTLALGTDKGITASGSLTDIDVVKLNGTNNIADTKLAAFDSTTKIEATANDKVTTTTTGALNLSALDKQGTVTPVIDITVAADTHAVSGSANLTENLYLGDGTGTWASADLTKYDANVDAIYATATKLVFASADKFDSKKLDLGKASADITITSVGADSGDLTKLFENATSDDKIALTLASGVTSVKLTAAAETIDASKVTPIAASTYNIAEKFVNIAANDTINGLKFGTQASGTTLALTLSDAKETIDISAAKGSGGALTITTTGFDKATDKIFFGATAAKGELTQTSIAAVDTDIKSITVTNGVLTLGGDSGAITGAKLTIGNVLSALKDTKTKDALIDQVLLFTDNAGKNYLVTAGGTNASTDDVAIVLTGVTTKGFSIDNGVVTLA